MKKPNVYSNEDLEKIRAQLIEHYKHIYDPEIPVNIFDLGLIYDISFHEKGHYLSCKIIMTLTSPGCPVADSLVDEVKYLTQTIPQIDEVEVEITFSPPWSSASLSQDARDIFELEGYIMPK